MTQIWTKDPLVLFKKDQLEFWPSKKQPLEEKVNAITRVIILLTLFGTVFTKKAHVAATGFIALISLMIIYYTQNSKTNKAKENMTPNMNLDNVMNDGEHLSSSIRGKIKDSSLDEAKRTRWFPEKTNGKMPSAKIAQYVRDGKMQQPTKKNPMMNVMMTDYKDDPKRPRAEPAFASKVRKDINKKVVEQVEEDLDEKLFKDLGDEIQFDRSMQQFYTTSNTQIPNNQMAFAEFCYGNMSSCKDGEVDKCFNDDKRIGQNYV